ncbi:MAG: hypothetical protein LBK13_01500 [Spirochaetales bacterium]|nr:hypothetical protein [Spirochaetales bacterium]
MKTKSLFDFFDFAVKILMVEKVLYVRTQRFFQILSSLFDFFDFAVKHSVRKDKRYGE